MCNLIKKGFSGVINSPSIGQFPDFPKQIVNDPNVGFDREVSMIKWCHELGLFTIGFVCSPENAIKMVQAGADLLIASIPEGVEMSFEEMKGCLGKIITAARSEGSRYILIHCSQYMKKDEIQELICSLGAEGLFGGACMDSEPITTALEKAIKEIQNIHTGI